MTHHHSIQFLTQQNMNLKINNRNLNLNIGIILTKSRGPKDGHFISIKPNYDKDK